MIDGSNSKSTYYWHNCPRITVACLEVLASLVARRINEHLQNNFVDEEGKVRFIAAVKSFIKVFDLVMLCPWDEGKEDRVVLHAFH